MDVKRLKVAVFNPEAEVAETGRDPRQQCVVTALILSNGLTRVPPLLNDVAGLKVVSVQVLVQALVPQPPYEALVKGVLLGLPGAIVPFDRSPEPGLHSGAT